MYEFVEDTGTILVDTSAPRGLEFVTVAICRARAGGNVRGRNSRHIRRDGEKRLRRRIAREPGERHDRIEEHAGRAVRVDLIRKLSVVRLDARA